MRACVVVLACAATPALAHHEVVVATSILPLMGGLAVIAAGVVTGVSKWLRSGGSITDVGMIRRLRRRM